MTRNELILFLSVTIFGFAVSLYFQNYMFQQRLKSDAINENWADQHGFLYFQGCYYPKLNPTTGEQNDEIQGPSNTNVNIILTPYSTSSSGRSSPN